MDAHVALGAALDDLGKRDDAVTSYRRALDLQSDHAEVHHALARTLQTLGLQDEAVVSYRRAVELNPGWVEAHGNLGNVLKDLGLFDDAITSYRRVLAIEPESAMGHYHLGVALHKLGQFNDAISSYRRALEIAPHYVEALRDQGIALHELGKPEAAVQCYRLALETNPDMWDVNNNLAHVLKELGQLDEAIGCYRRSLAINPDMPDVHNNLGIVLQSCGQLDNAVASYRRTLEIKPDHAVAHNNLGTALRRLDQHQGALASFRRALQIKPNFADAHNNLGATFSIMGQIDDSVASYRRALEIDPDNANAHMNLGNALKDYGQIEAALISIRRALAIQSDSTVARSNLLFVYNYQSEQPAHDLLEEAKRYGEIVKRPVRAFTAWHNSAEPARYLRIGLISGDLRQHPVGNFLESVLVMLDADASSRIEFFAYPSAICNDEVSNRIKACCREWHSTLGLSDERLAQRIRDDGIDILIDLAGHTAHNRLPVFAWKPAPVQVTWLGYFATTGVAEIDYLIADPWTLSASDEANFTEKIWRLPETRLCFTPPNVDVDGSTPLPALSNGYLTFACFNNLAKVNATVVALWARLLIAVPDSRLFFMAPQLNDATAQQELMARFSVHGINGGRLVVQAAVPRAAYLATYQRVDIALDPFPYTGGTTTAEALWMGVPVLTLAGKSFLSRQGMGLLMNAGLPEWIAADPDDYVARAIRHASDLQGLSALRARLRQQVLASPIFDAHRFAEHFEAALRGMWQKWCHDNANAQSRIEKASNGTA